MLKRSGALCLIVIFLTSVALQVAAASQKSFWEDEAFTAAIAGRSADALAQAASMDVHPPLFLFLARLWGDVFGFNELGLRSLSILFAALTLLMTFWLARTLLDERTALASAAVLGLSPLFIMFGHNARYYSLAACLALVITFAMLRFQVTGKPLYWLLYGLAGVAILYLLYAAGIVILLCNLWWLILWGKERPRSLRRLSAWLILQAVVLLASLPGLALLMQTADRFSEIASGVNWVVELTRRLGYTGYVFGLGETLSPLNPLAWLGVVLLIALGVWAIIANRARLGFWLAATFFAGILALNVLISVNAAVSLTWQSLPTRAFYALPYLAICLGAGLAALKPRLLFVAGILLLLVYGAASWNYFTGRQHLRPIYAVPWRQIYQNIQQGASLQTYVICGRGDYACKYYAQRFGYQPYASSQFTDLAQGGKAQVWWIQSYLGRDLPEEKSELDRIEQILQDHPAAEIYSYAPQDASIRWLKRRFLQQEDYAYRVQVYQFTLP